MVASAIVNGTSIILAKVWANNVLPHPVGPTNNMFDLDISTSSIPFDALSLL